MLLVFTVDSSSRVVCCYCSLKHSFSILTRQVCWWQILYFCVFQTLSFLPHLWRTVLLGTEFSLDILSPNPRRDIPQQFSLHDFRQDVIHTLADPFYVMNCFPAFKILGLWILTVCLWYVQVWSHWVYLNYRLDFSVCRLNQIWEVMDFVSSNIPSAFFTLGNHPK